MPLPMPTVCQRTVFGKGLTSFGYRGQSLDLYEELRLSQPLHDHKRVSRKLPVGEPSREKGGPDGIVLSNVCCSDEEGRRLDDVGERGVGSGQDRGQIGEGEFKLRGKVTCCNRSSFAIYSRLPRDG